MIMHCPHGVPDCPTCERSAAALELRDLRRVARAARRLIVRLGDDATLSRESTHELAGMLMMARETSTFLPPGTPNEGGGGG